MSGDAAVNSGHVAANRRRYARIAPLYDLLDRAFEGHYRAGRVLIGQQAIGVTLEVGVGTGKNFQYYRSEARVFASDLSRQMLDVARRKLRSPIRALLAAEVAALPFRSLAADTVVATFVCCVQDDPVPSLAEIARVLKPGGRVLCLDYTVPERRLPRLAMRLIEPLLRAVYGIRWDHDVPRLLEQGGLRVRLVRRVWGPVVRYIEAEKPAASAS